MAKDIVQQSPFDSIRKVDAAGVESWSATELLSMLGYKSWKRIKDTTERAKVAALNSGAVVDLHFADVVQVGQIGKSNATRSVLKDFVLSRYACYLVAMNGDPRKPEIALAQSYFATKTREAELAQKAPAKILNRNYSSARKECCDQLKRHGATGKTYGAVEKYNNELSGIESGSRHELTYEQAHQVGNNYLFAAIELLKRDAGFNNGNQYHLAATTKMGMRHGMYEQLGADSVPEKLKPKKERKQLKAS